MFRIAVGLYVVWVAALALSVGCHAMNHSRTASLRPTPIRIEPSPVVARGKGTERVDRDLQPVSATAVNPRTEETRDPVVPAPAPADPVPDLLPKPASNDSASASPPLRRGPKKPAEPTLPTPSSSASPRTPAHPEPAPVEPVVLPEPADAPRSPEPDGVSAPNSLLRVDQLCRRAEEFNERHPDFVCRMTRSERIQGSIRSPELMLMKLRGTPRSVHLKWLDSANDGRECIYIAGQNNGKMISRGGRGDLLLAGRTLWLDPESGLAKSKSSQTITETGLDVTCAKIRRRIDRLKQGDESLGTLSASTGPDPFLPDRLYDWIDHQAPPGVDSDLPRGGVHRYGFRPDTGQLEVVHAFNRRDELMYTFRFERLIPVAQWQSEDFNVELLANKRGRGDGNDEKNVVQKEGETSR